ncbi:MAG: PAS domain S-box protein [Candidatus Nitrospinota bacterium M3_3B_026]
MGDISSGHGGPHGESAGQETEDALRRSWENLSSAMRLARLGTWEWDIVSGRIAWSDQIYRAFGFEPGEFEATYEAFLSHVHPGDRERVSGEVRRAVEDGAPYDTEYRIIRRDGTERVAHTVGEVIRDSGGRPVRMVGSQQDITGRKRAEEKLAASEKELSAILNNIPDVYYRTDNEGRLTHVSGALKELLGYTPDELFGRRLTDFYLYPERRKQLFKELDEHGGKVKNFEAQLIHKSGEIIWVSSNAQHYYDDEGDVLGVEGLARDVTKRRSAEVAMRMLVEETAAATGLEFFRALTRSLGEAIGVRFAFISRLVDENTAETVTFWDNGEFLDNVEYPLEGTPCHEIYKRKDACFYPSGIQETFPEDEMLIHMGAQSYFGAPFRGADGDITGHLGVMHDRALTGREYIQPIVKLFAARAGAELERMNAEIELKKLKNAIEQSPDTVVMTDSEGFIEYVNPAASRITGYSAEELIGRNPRILKSGKHDKSFYKDLWDTIKAGRIWSGAVINRRKSGELYYEEMTIAPVRDEKGNVCHFVAVKRDVTERVRAEKELKTAKEKAEEATMLKDQFVTLVSHDLRSPIASIFTLLNTLDEDLSDVMDERKKRMMRSAVSILDSLITQIDQLLNISMLQTGRIRPRLRPVNARSIVAGALEGLSHAASGAGVRIENNVPADTRLYADVDLFSQVIQNLVSNAVKFTPKGGRITIFIPEGRPSTIAVRDTGSGIRPEILPDIFKSEVKTTTLGVRGEKGTGLGLPFCRDIMEAHGGSLTAEPVEDGAGSVFYAELPEGRPIILVTGGDESERARLKTVLGAVEADVVEAADGGRALASANGKTPSLVIMDIDAPGGPGLALLEEMKASRDLRYVPVIVAAAKDEATVREKALKLGADGFIVKSLAESELTLKVRDFLG